jgi:uncharacterized protein
VSGSAKRHVAPVKSVLLNHHYHQHSMDLSPIETRILGCLLEKERTTPEYYPLSLVSLTAACNQTTNRDPIVGYDERTVERGLDDLRARKLAMLIHTAGARVPKYRHSLLDVYNLNAREVALLCVLLLRGPQTQGELRSRIERLCGPMTLQEVEACLEDLARGDDPLVRVILARPGQKEKRYVQLLSAERDLEMSATIPPPALESVSEKSRLDVLECELNALRSELHALRNELEEFKKLFG